MEDIDKDQWAHAQDILLESSKEKSRLIVLHDNGIIRKIGRTDGTPVVASPESIVDAQSQARKLFEANQDGLDFVAIYERHAFDEYFSRMQNSWIADEPLDSFVDRQYRLLDEYPDDLVTYPGPAKCQMGLQYRFGTERNEAIALAHKWASPNTSILLGIYQEGQLWASLVMSFDGGMDISALTTVDAERVDVVGDISTVTERAMDWLSRTHLSAAAALVWRMPAFEEFKKAENKEAAVAKALMNGSAVLVRR
jgi:hypothetical protein